MDWAEDHHDVCVMRENEQVLRKRRVRDSVVGIPELDELAAEHQKEDEAVVVGIETDRAVVVGGTANRAQPAAARAHAWTACATP